MPFSIPDGLRSHGRVSRALFALALFGSAFALGGLHTPVLCAAAALMAGAAFFGWYRAEPAQSRLPATILFVTGVALTAFTALQALPLPAGLVRLLSSATADVWSGAFAPLREAGPAWTTLSLDPTATRVQVLRGVVYLTTFVAALRICDRHGGARFLTLVIVVTAVGLAVAAMLHPMFGAQRVFGVYRPQDTISERHIAPLLNPNHLAAYLNIGFCLALGMAIDRRAERLRPIAIASALFLAATQIWVASRGGMVALVFGAVCTAMMARVSRRFALKASAQILIPLLVVAAGLAMVVVGSSPDAVNELNSTDVSKTRLAMDGLRLVPHHALFGVGRGAYEVAFPLVRTDPGFSLATHPENLPVQWLTEWGVPVALAGFVAMAIALRPRVLLVSSSPAIGAWCAIATTVVHNLVDFSSEVPAIGIALAACGAMVVAGHGTARSGVIHRWGKRPRTLSIALAGATVLLSAITLATWPHELDEERIALYHDVTQPDLQRNFADVVHAALARHPSEPYVPFIASVDASRRGRSVVPWVERTLSLAPIYAPAHFVLAQQLSPLSASQARLEYRLTVEQESGGSPLMGRAILLGSQLVGSYDDALELLPPKFPVRGRVLEELAEALGRRLPATTERLDEMLRKADPNSRQGLERSLRNTMADVEAGRAAPWCDGEYSCVETGLATAARLQALTPGSCEPLVASARLLIAANRAADGLHALREGAQTASNPLECWRGLGELALRANNDVYVEVAEEEVGRSGCDTESECANNLMWIGGLEEGRGNPRRAVGYFQRAHEKSPDRTDILERLGSLASMLGMHAQALEAFRALQARSPDARWEAAAEREKSTLFQPVAPLPGPPD
jgi:tetratricopeptide (TPR) repeat protein